MRSVFHHRSFPGQVIPSLILFLGLCCTVLVKADQWGDWTYTTDGSNVTITGYTGIGGDIVTPDTISGLPVISIAIFSFLNNLSLTSVVIGTNVLNIGDSAFGLCTNLNNVVISRNVTNIESQAFQNCMSLTNVDFGMAAPRIGEWAFVFCMNLRNFTVDASNPAYSSIDGVLFNKSFSELIVCPAGKTGDYAIPNNVTRLHYTSFSGCALLTSITFSSSVTDIGAYAFGGCIRVANQISLNNITNLGIGAFYNCPMLAGVTIGNGIANIEEDTFYRCSNLTNVVVPYGVSNIGDYAFASCSALTSVTIPESVTHIGQTTFNNCSSLGVVTIPSSVISIGAYAFEACGSLMGVYYKGNAPSGDGTVFSSTYSVTSYYYPWNSGWTYTYAGRPTQINPDYTQWRNNYGFTTSLTNDFDNDGMLNWQEYLAGTSPTNDADRLAISFMGSGSNLSLISWLAKSNVSYQVMRCSDLLGTWGNAASGAETNQQAQQTATTDQILQYMDPGYIGVSNTFYRVNVVP